MAAPIDIRSFETIKATGELPSPRGVAIAIIRQTQDSEVSMAELARVIKGDPAFVGRLIKAANGLVAESRRAVVSVQEALMVLGLPAVRAMALGFSLLSNYRRGACRSFDYEQFWSAAMLSALAMQRVSQRVRAMAADEAFSLGLLASIGELAMATLYPVEFSAVLDEAVRDPATPQIEIERRMLAIDHRALGAAMLIDWGFPQLLARATENFVRPDLGGAAPDSRDERLMRSLGLADAIAQFYLAARAEHAGRGGELQQLAAQLGIAREDFAALCERVGRDWIDWGKLLDLKIGEVPRLESLFSEPAMVPVSASALAEPTALAPAAMPAELGGDAGFRVLLVGGDRADEAMLRTELAGAGVGALRVEAGAHAVVAMIDFQPQMMVIDWGAPDCGPALVRVLRETRLGRTMYVIALVDSGDERILNAAAAAGVDDFLVRPLSAGVLHVRLRVGQRMVSLQRELEREREDLRHFAAELSISNRRLQEAAMTDALTGFPNRRYMADRLHNEWAGALRHQRSLALMIIDLDGFKIINDEHGHDVGDMVLRQGAEAMRRALRAQDVICRSGGDEFLVVCPDTGLDDALNCAERLRAAVASFKVDAGRRQLELTVSIGVAARVPSMSSVEELVKSADQGAYLAKERGRNRVESRQMSG